jgi:hypothetical protein
MNSESVNPIKALKAFPLNEIDRFPAWAQRYLSKYASTQNFHQTFQVSHSVMIFQSLCATNLSPSDNWLWQSSMLALRILSKINDSENPAVLSKMDDELFATLLLIKEYFVINGCWDPNSCLIDIGKVWIEPDHDGSYYLEKFNLNYEVLSS